MSLHVNHLSGFGVGAASPYLYDIIVELGLLASFNLCLDAADPRSYDGSAQTWTDIIGGNNFLLGTTSGADATDPAFVGAAGVANGGTYFSFDGGDYFTETAAHTFADNWHKNNGAFSIIAGYYTGGGATIRSIFSNDTGVGLDGITLRVSATDTVLVNHALTGTTTESIDIGALTAAAWNFIGVSFDEANLLLTYQRNGTASTSAITGSTDADANGQVLRIGADGDAGSPLLSGDRLAFIVAGSTAIGAAALANFRTILKARRFPSFP